MEQRIQSRFDLMVRDQLELSDEQGQQLGDIVEGFLQRRQELALRERQVRGTVLSLGTRSAEEGEFSDEEATDALQEMVRLREEETSLFREEQEALVGVLTPQQLVRFVVMRGQLAERIQRIRSGERPRGGPRGRPRGGRLPEGVGTER
jgi:Spy/CpxP family protein refolding chaperone